MQETPRPASALTRPSARELLRFFVWLGTTGFGGPIALVGYMEREFVDRRRWATRAELQDGIAFSQLAPGPLAAQLAMYLGWICAGFRGATAAAVGFVAPSFVMVIGLAVLYQRYGGIPWLQGAFYGIGAAVIAIIARSAAKLARTVFGGDRFLWTLGVLSAIVTILTESEIVWVFLTAGLVTLLVRSPPAKRAAEVPMLLPLLDVPRPEWLFALAPGTLLLPTLITLFLYFGAAGMFVFGSGLAIVPFLHGGVVTEHNWLSERQFLDAVAVALVTPGPVVITVAFIGFLVAGYLGATVAALGVFAPVYVITVLLAPYYERLKRNARVRAFVDGVTAAATGAIAGAAFVLGRRAIVDWKTAVIAGATLLLLLPRRRIPDPLIILVAGAVGILLLQQRAHV